MPTHINGGYYRVISQYLYHAYATADPDVAFYCWLGIDGEDNHPDAASGEGDADLARIICCMDPDDLQRSAYGKPFTPTMFKDTSGIFYGFTGVCHQMCNRILYAAGALNFPTWWMVPYVVYGFYGNRYHIRHSDLDADRKYNWQEYLSAATLLFEGVPLSDGAIAAGVPAVREKVLGMGALYPEWDPLIQLEVEEVDSILLPLLRIELLLRRTMEVEEISRARPTLEAHVIELDREMRRLRREVETAPDTYGPRLAAVGKIIEEKLGALRPLMGEKPFVDVFAHARPEAIPLAPIRTIRGADEQLGRLYREQLEKHRKLPRK